MLETGVDLHDVQIASRHADPRATMRCDRAERIWTGAQRHPRHLHGIGRPARPEQRGCLDFSLPIAFDEYSIK